jgi:hypothetical protein
MSFETTHKNLVPDREFNISHGIAEMTAATHMSVSGIASSEEESCSLKRGERSIGAGKRPL